MGRHDVLSVSRAGDDRRTFKALSYPQERVAAAAAC